MVPIQHNSTEDDLLYFFKSVNGILLPGGAVSLHGTQYYETVKTLYAFAVQVGNLDQIHVNHDD